MREQAFSATPTMSGTYHEWLDISTILLLQHPMVTHGSPVDPRLFNGSGTPPLQELLQVLLQNGLASTSLSLFGNQKYSNCR